MKLRKNKHLPRTLAKVLAVLMVLALLLATFIPLAFADEKPVLKDIAKHWSKDTVEWAVDRGLVTGYPDGTFKPNNLVTEEEFLAMLVRAYHPEIGIAKGRWAENYYDFAYEKNYPVIGQVYRDEGKKMEVTAKGIEDLRKRVPKRLKIAELIAATQGYNYTGNDAVRFVLGENLAKGKVVGQLTVRNYDKEGELTRAEAVQFIKNVLDNGKSELEARPEQVSDTSTLKDIPTGNKVYGNVVFGDYIDINGKPLMIPDPAAHKVLTKIVESIEIKNKTLSFVIPEMPKGYTLWYKYADKTEGATVDYLDHYEQGLDLSKSGKIVINLLPKHDPNAMLVLGINNWSETATIIDSAYIYIPSLVLKSTSAGWND